MFVDATLTRHVVTYSARRCPLILDIPKLCTVSKLVPDVLSKVVNYCFQNPLLTQKSRPADQRMRTQTIIGYASSRPCPTENLFQNVTCRAPSSLPLSLPAHSRHSSALSLLFRHRYIISVHRISVCREHQMFWGTKMTLLPA